MGLHHRTDAYSTDSYHSIHVKPATQPTARLRPPPGEACHRRSAATLGGILLVRRRRAWLGRQGQVPAPEPCASNAGAAAHPAGLHSCLYRRQRAPLHRCGYAIQLCPHQHLALCRLTATAGHTRDLSFPSTMAEPMRPSPLSSARGFSQKSSERVWNCVRCGTTPHKASMPTTPYPMIPHTRAVS
jgi:hypothetical protein